MLKYRAKIRLPISRKLSRGFGQDFSHTSGLGTPLSYIDFLVIGDRDLDLGSKRVFPHRVLYKIQLALSRKVFALETSYLVGGFSHEIATFRHEH